MISKDALLAAMERECDIAVHLHGKIPPGAEGFRFTPPQRSTLELLRYLSFAGIAFAEAAVTSDWESYTARSKAAETLSLEDFPAAMARQKADLRNLFDGLTEQDLQNRTFTQPWGESMALGPALLVLAYASLVAYRMQLFLQAKAAGNASIGTSNCWAGVDMPAS